jgi:TonB family protein
MHRVEKLILSDPLYQEAMDGLESIDADQVDKDLSELSDRIKTRTASEGKRYVQFYRIAAAVILLAVFSYIIIQTISRMASFPEKDVLTQKEKDTVSLIKPDDQRVEETKLLSKEKTESDHNKAERSTRETNVENQDVQTSVTEDHGQDEPADANGTSGQNGEVVDSNVDFEDEIRQAGLADSEKWEEDIQAAEPQRISEEPFMEENMESEMIARTPEKSAKEKQETLDISLPDPKDVEERSEIDTGPATTDHDKVLISKRIHSEDGNRHAAKVAAAAPEKYPENELQPVPVKGFKDYLKYIEENLQYPPRALADSIKGAVIVRFVINRDSIPEKFKIIQSLSNNCDREAIRLIEEGPKWIPVYSGNELNEVEVNYTITFDPER